MRKYGAVQCNATLARLIQAVDTLLRRGKHDDDLTLTKCQPIVISSMIRIPRGILGETEPNCSTNFNRTLDFVDQELLDRIANSLDRMIYCVDQES